MPHRLKFGHRSGRLLAALLTVGFTASLSQNAHASGFALMEQNASGLGNAYAGQAAAAEDASTIFFNPAGMTYIKGRQVVGALNAIKTSGDFNDKGSRPPYVTLAPGFDLDLGHAPGGDGGDSGDLSLVPNGYVSVELVPDQVWIGLGVGAPFGLKTEWDDDWVGRFHGTESELMTININPSVAWKINPMISAGVGVNIQRIDTTLSSQISYRAVALSSGIGPIIAGTPPGSEGEAKIEGDDWGFGWNAGLMFDLSPSTRLGLAYRSRIEYELKGNVSFSNRPVALGLVPNVADGNIRADVEVPASFSVALAHQLTPKLQVLADYTWTGWDSIKTVRINRESGEPLTTLDLELKDSWRVGLGLNYQYSDALKLRIGVAVDKTPVEDEFRTPRLPDEDRTWLGLGAQWKFSPVLTLDVGYAYLWVKDADINLSNTSANSALPRGDLRGDFESDVHIFSAQVSYSF